MNAKSRSQSEVRRRAPVKEDHIIVDAFAHLTCVCVNWLFLATWGQSNTLKDRTEKLRNATDTEFHPLVKVSRSFAAK